VEEEVEEEESSSCADFTCESVVSLEALAGLCVVENV